MATIKELAKAYEQPQIKNVADLDKLAVKYQDLDFEKEKKDLEALSKLLPAFQGSKNAIQRSMIIKEMDKLNRKITYEGFVLLNEQKSGSEDLSDIQGMGSILSTLKV